MSHEVVDGNEWEPKLGGEIHQLRADGHVQSVAATDFTEQTGWGQTCQTGQVDSGLSMTLAAEHPFRLRNQREDVSRTNEVIWCG